jgi:hypothetical protein
MEEYGEQGASPGAPPLEVVSWDKDKVNSVQLLGTVGIMEVRQLSSGKTKASFGLAVNKPMPPGGERQSDWCARDAARRDAARRDAALLCAVTRGLLAACWQRRRSSTCLPALTVRVDNALRCAAALQVQRGGLGRAGAAGGAARAQGHAAGRHGAPVHRQVRTQRCACCPSDARAARWSDKTSGEARSKVVLKATKVGVVARSAGSAAAGCACNACCVC